MTVFFLSTKLGLSLWVAADAAWAEGISTHPRRLAKGSFGAFGASGERFPVDRQFCRRKGEIRRVRILQGFGGLGNRVESPGMKRVAPGDPAQGQPGSADGAMPPDRLRCINRAGRLKAAARRRPKKYGERRGDEALVDVDGPEQPLGGQADQLEKYSRAPPGSDGPVCTADLCGGIAHGARVSAIRRQASTNLRSNSANGRRFTAERATITMSASRGRRP